MLYQQDELNGRRVVMGTNKKSKNVAASEVRDTRVQKPTPAASEQRPGSRATVVPKKNDAEILGIAVSFLMRSYGYEQYSLADLKWLLFPPLKLKQFEIIFVKNEAEDILPVAMGLWARVSPEVDARLTENITNPLRLKPDDWSSGENYWLIDIFGVPSARDWMVTELRTTYFKDRSVKVRKTMPDGRVLVSWLYPQNEADALISQKKTKAERFH
jgi:hemolysin-activating ACP:hemolysin acyltransferase